MELIILSGKGGTGKTTIAAALSELASCVTRVDCDVDAANFHLYYKDGKDKYKQDFISGKKARINNNLCIKCKKCYDVCRFNAIKNFKIDEFSCEGCGTCSLVCPKSAISLFKIKSAENYITELNDGIISRADMKIGSDGSGKLVNVLRNNAKKYSNKNNLTIVDGSPGIGCQVISSITGSDLVLIITEPTKSGIEDLKRVLELCNHFKIKALVCINKFDINLNVSNQIENFLNKDNIEIVGRIPYDDYVMQSINELKPIIYYENSKANKAIRNMWLNIKNILMEE